MLNSYKKFHYQSSLCLLILGLSILFLHEARLEVTLASYFFDLNQGWLYQNNFFLEKILHKGGVLFIIAIYIFILVKFLYFYIKKQKFLFYLFVFCSSLLSLILINGLKKITTIPCPWHCQVFSGPREFVSLLDIFSSNMAKGNCFPAGHSSAGFALLSFYFAHVYILKNNSWIYAIPGLLIGFVFGFAQQMRGAHFLSHDIMGLFLTIISNIFIGGVFYAWNRSKA